LAAAQDESVIRGRRRGVAQLAGARAADGAGVSAGGVESEHAGALERVSGDDAIVVALVEQDADFVTRPRRTIRAIRLVQEVEVEAGISDIGGTCLVPERCPLPRMPVAEIAGR